MLGRDQFEHGVAQVLQPFIVGRSTFGVLVVVRPMRQGLAQERRLVKANAKRPLKFL
jgi:hypothetical protein